MQFEYLHCVSKPRSSIAQIENHLFNVISEAHLVPCQTSMRERFSQYSRPLLTVKHFRKKKQDALR